MLLIRSLVGRDPQVNCRRPPESNDQTSLRSPNLQSGVIHPPIFLFFVLKIKFMIIFILQELNFVRNSLNQLP